MGQVLGGKKAGRVPRFFYVPMMPLVGELGLAV